MAMVYRVGKDGDAHSRLDGVLQFRIAHQSFVMRPHAQHLDDLIFFQHLVHQPVLNIDAA